jgi:phosphohistidine phosphatase
MHGVGWLIGSVVTGSLYDQSLIGGEQAVRRLFLFRHAKAIRSKPGTEDRTRALIERGRKDSARIGAYMAAEALVPDRVLISPAVRTQETWKFTVSAFHPAVEVITAEQLYDAKMDTITAVIRKTPAEVHSVLVIGHNPGLHDLALRLTASGNVRAHKRLKKKLPTAGLVIIDFDFDDWSKLREESGRLDRFISPKSLR